LLIHTLQTVQNAKQRTSLLLAVSTTPNELDAWYSGKDRFIVALRPPGREQRLEGELLVSSLLAEVRLAGLDEDVEIAYGTEPTGDFPHHPPVVAGAARPEAVAEDAPRGAHPAGCHAHPVEFLSLSGKQGAQVRASVGVLTEQHGLYERMRALAEDVYHRSAGGIHRRR
jgi:hypothetical protein